MKKIILTVAIAFTVGILSLLNTTDNSSKKIKSVKLAQVMFDQKNILATAD